MICDFLAEIIDTRFRLLAKLVQHLTELAFLVGRNITKLIEKGGYFTFLTEVLNTQRFEFLSIRSLEIGDLRQ